MRFSVKSGVLFALGIGLCLFDSGCARTRVPLTSFSLPVPSIITPLLTPLFGRAEGDFRSLSRERAFEKLHAKLAAEYPFTEHKNIDWDALYAHYAPMVKAASSRSAADQYYLILRAYLFSIPDGMIGMTYRKDLLDPGVAASFGFRPMTLDDGRTIAHGIRSGSTAELAGMEPGAEIIAWNNKPIAEALDMVETYWPDAPAASAELQHLRALHYIRRGRVGEKAVITYLNPGAEVSAVAGLTAEKDDYEGLRGPAHFYAPIGEEATPVHAEELPSGIAYIRVYFMGQSFNTPFPNRAFHHAVDEAVKAEAKGIILDLRGNGTGVDAFIPEFASQFVADESLLQRTAVLNMDGEFEIDPSLDLNIVPRDPQVNCPVIVLVSASTAGSCEGLAWILQQQPKIEVMGFHGTSGTYGLAGGEIQMPGGFTVIYPMGRYENDNGILLTADGNGAGGVTPDIRLPITEETLHSMRVEGRDVLLDAAVEHLEQQTGELP